MSQDSFPNPVVLGPNIPNEPTTPINSSVPDDAGRGPEDGTGSVSGGTFSRPPRTDREPWLGRASANVATAAVNFAVGALSAPNPSRNNNNNNNPRHSSLPHNHAQYYYPHQDRYHNGENQFRDPHGNAYYSQSHDSGNAYFSQSHNNGNPSDSANYDPSNDYRYRAWSQETIEVVPASFILP
jgi:hypothetical protein